MAQKKDEKRRVVKKIVERYDVLVIGCGGTGTYFLKEFNHFLARNQGVQKKIASLTIADGDDVEEKNLDRQVFLMEDVGRNKANVFAEILNDALEGYNIPYSFQVRWNSIPSYITSLDTLKEVLKLKHSIDQESYSSVAETLTIRIPLIIGCVDNDAARMMCEELFKELPYCFYYDSGNDFSTGEVNYAHRFSGKTLSFEKSYSFGSMKTGDLRHVNELSCTELNASAPQHFITNMTAAQWLLRGVVNLFGTDKSKSVLDNIQGQLGYVFFDAFTGISEFTERSYRTERNVPNEKVS